MSGIKFDAVPFPEEQFGTDWQVQIGAHIRIAGFVIEKTKDELRAGFEAEPEAMTELAENFTEWADRLMLYHQMVQAAQARLLVVGAEFGGVPLEVCEG